MKVNFWKRFHEALVVRIFGEILTLLPCSPELDWKFRIAMIHRLIICII